MDRRKQPQTIEHRRKIGEANKIALKGKHNSPKTEFKKGISNFKHSEILTGRKHTQEHRDKIGLAHKGIKTGFDAIAVTDIRIKNEIPELERQGFKCIPVGGKIRPDIIAIKNGKIYAIEVEYRKRPNYSKYDNDYKKYIDEVIWINKHKYPIN